MPEVSPIRSTVRSIRLERDLLNKLEKDARAKRTTLNNLISTILKRHGEWGRYTDHGFITVTQRTFISILEGLEAKKLEKIAQEVGDRIPKSNLLTWFKEVNLPTFLAFIELYGKYSGAFQCEIENNEEHYTIVTQHDLGRKWSEFIKLSLDRSIRILVGVAPQFEVQDDIVIAKFTANSNKVLTA